MTIFLTSAPSLSPPPPSSLLSRSTPPIPSFSTSLDRRHQDITTTTPPPPPPPPYSLSHSSTSPLSPPNTPPQIHHPTLRVFIYGDIVGGFEYGFPIPEAGKDQEWMRANLSAFEAKAEEGEEVMKDLVAEIKERKLLG